MEKVLEDIMANGLMDWLIIIGVGSAVFMGALGIIFEILEIIFLLTPSDKDDIWLAKVRARWAKYKPFLEWFHIKTPLVKFLAKIRNWLVAIKNTVKEFKKDEKPKKSKKMTEAEKQAVLKRMGGFKKKLNSGSTVKPGLLKRRTQNKKEETKN